MLSRTRLPLAVLCLAAAACEEPLPVNTPVTPPAPPSAATLPSAAPGVSAAPAAPGYPVAARRPVVEEYHGVKVADDYRWLEKSDDPEVLGWTKEQTKQARAVLDTLPAAAALRKRVTALRS